MIIQDVLLSALADRFPPYGNYALTDGADQIANLEEALNWLESRLSELEEKLGTSPAVARLGEDKIIR